MNNSIESNLKKWNDEYHWVADGDEWNGQARVSGQPYRRWKASVVEFFICPNIDENAVVLEIAPGHGRWTRELIDHCKELFLVDLSPNCIDFCRSAFATYDHVTYIVNDGKSLPGVSDNHVDFIWSFDSFVHMTGDVIAAYLREIHRVLKRGGRAILHHANRRHAFLSLGFLGEQGRLGKRAYQIISMGKVLDNDGWRSNVSRKLVAEMAGACGLTVESQIQTWGPQGEFNVVRYRDYISILTK